MKVTFKIFGFPGLCQTVGSRNIDIEFQGKTVRDFIAKLVKTYGSEVEENIFDYDGQLKPTVRLLKNGRQWINQDDLETDLMDGDVVVLTLLVTGG